MDFNKPFRDNIDKDVKVLKKAYESLMDEVVSKQKYTPHDIVVSAQKLRTAAYAIIGKGDAWRDELGRREFKKVQW